MQRCVTRALVLPGRRGRALTYVPPCRCRPTQSKAVAKELAATKDALARTEADLE